MRLFAAILACSYAVGCATVPRPSCSVLAASTTAATVQAGYKLAETQGSPTGEMAAFVRGPVARLFYVAPAAGVADYLESEGWTKVGECLSPKATVYTILQRDIEVPSQGGPA